MGKKKLRKARQSKGQRSLVSSGLTQAVRSERTYLDKLDGIIKAWEAHLNPWLLIDNSNKSQTNKLKYYIRANDYWGVPYKPGMNLQFNS
jgi:nitrate/nitrite-specific signal transduction histidine kinase